MLNPDPKSTRAYVIVAEYDDDEEVYIEAIEVHKSKENAEKEAERYTKAFDKMRRYNEDFMDFEYAYKKRHPLPTMKPRVGRITPEQKLEILEEKKIYLKWKFEYDEAMKRFEEENYPIASLKLYGRASDFIVFNYKKGCWEGGFRVEETDLFL